MNGRVRHKHTLSLGLVLAPDIVKAYVVGKVLLEHGTVQRTNHINIECSGLLEQGLNLIAVLSADVDVVPACLALPCATVAKRTELTECIGREEHLLALLIAHHHLGPVYHGRQNELQGMCTQREGIALLDGNATLIEVNALEELGHHLQRLGCGNHLTLWVLYKNLGNERCMVGLYVMHYKIIGSAAGKGSLYVSPPLRPFTGIGRIHDCDLFIENYVRIIGHSIRYLILALKEVNIKVIHTYILY